MAAYSSTPGPYKAPLAIAPGFTIRELLEDRGMTQKELALRMGRPPQAINEIIQGKKEITSDTAVQLETVLGLSKAYWLTRQQNYDETKRRIAEQHRQEQEEISIKQDAARLSAFPYAELVNRGFVSATRRPRDRVIELRRFLQVATFDALDEYVDSFPMAARLAQTSDLTREKLAVWLRIALRMTENYGWSPGRFRKSVLEKMLPEVRRLSREHDSTVYARLQAMMLECGLALLYVQEFKGFPAKGMAVWIRETPFILLTLHGKQHDRLWFSLFHELGHVLMHDKRVIVEGKGLVEDEKMEQEADQFARDNLIPPADYERLLSKTLTPAWLERFAEAIEIDPGIVVGRLQHEERLGWGDPRFARFRRRVQWIES